MNVEDLAAGRGVRRATLHAQEPGLSPLLDHGALDAGAGPHGREQRVGHGLRIEGADPGVSQQTDGGAAGGVLLLNEW